MDEFFRQLDQIAPVWVYLLLLIFAFLENVVPPIPGDTITVAGAYLVGTGHLDLLPVFATTTAGSFLGFMALYLAGRKLERSVIHGRAARYFPVGKIEMVEGWFRKYGLWLILVNRFLSGARSIISLISGMSELPVRPVALLALLSCSVWNGLLIWGGYVAGSNWERITALIKQYNLIILAVTAIAAGWYLLHKWRQRRKARPAE